MRVRSERPSVERSTVMTKRRLFLGSVSLLFVAGCASSSNAPAAGGVTCGTTPATFDLTTIGRAEGLVVGPDGTIYFSDFGPHVMRFAPPYDKPPEKTWVTIDGTRILGVMIDPKRKLIYAGARAAPMTTTQPALFKIDITDPTKVTKVVDVEPEINGLTMGDDGSVYYANQGGLVAMPPNHPVPGAIYRVTPDGVKSQVTKDPIDNPDGIAFGPDKKLYTIPYLGTGCPITRFTLDANYKEVSREVYVDLVASGGKNGDGIAFDKAGNLYLTAGALFKVTAADKKVTMLSPQGGANVEFGAGALACTELLWVVNSGTGNPQHMKNDTEGLDVYWHRP
jgi:sugar lactone lactonase YvrE